MPSHLYIVKRHPPALVDIVLAHSAEIGVAIYSAFIGIIVIINAHAYEAADGGILHRLPLYLVYGIGGFVCAGGLTAMWGLLIRRNNIRAELNVEQIGWIILSVGWFAYLYAAIRYGGGISTAMLSGACIGTAAALRAVALIVLEKELDKAVKEGTDTHEEGNHGNR